MVVRLVEANERVCLPEANERVCLPWGECRSPHAHSFASGRHSVLLLEANAFSLLIRRMRPPEANVGWPRPALPPYCHLFHLCFCFFFSERCTSGDHDRCERLVGAVSGTR